jgi:hypothetical protein
VVIVVLGVRAMGLAGCWADDVGVGRGMGCCVWNRRGRLLACLVVGDLYLLEFVETSRWQSKLGINLLGVGCCTDGEGCSIILATLVR